MSAVKRMPTISNFADGNLVLPQSWAASAPQSSGRQRTNELASTKGAVLSRLFPLGDLTGGDHRRSTHLVRCSYGAMLIFKPQRELDLQSTVRQPPCRKDHQYPQMGCRVAGSLSTVFVLHDDRSAAQRSAQFRFSRRLGPGDPASIQKFTVLS